MDRTPLPLLLERMQTAHRGVVESAAHPTSKPYRDSSRAFQRNVSEIANTVQLLEQEREKPWVPVNETLPDDQLLVLVALNDDDVWIGFRDAGIWRYVDAMPIEAERVTHWKAMPLPPDRLAE